MAVTSMSVTSKRVSRSLTNKWLGSYEIAEVKNKGNYRLRNPSTNNILAKMVNASRLKRYHQPSDEPEPPCKRSKNAETTTKSKKVPPCSWCVSCNGKVYIVISTYTVMVGSGVRFERRRQVGHWEWKFFEWPSHACCAEAPTKAIPWSWWLAVNFAVSEWWFWDCVQWR